jgi:hypothetical protein
VGHQPIEVFALHDEPWRHTQIDQRRIDARTVLLPLIRK